MEFKQHYTPQTHNIIKKTRKTSKRIRAKKRYVSARERTKKSILRAKKGDERTMRKTESTTIIIDVKAESIYKPGIKKDEMKRIRSIAIAALKEATKKRDKQRNDEKKSVRNILFFIASSKLAIERASELCVEEIYTS